MARYIDADRLSRQILDSWDNDNHHTIQASQVHRQEHQHLMRMIEKQPTADVVPKSEVTKLEAELDDLKRDTVPKLQWSLERANAMGRDMESKYIQQIAEVQGLREMVREIFEEIEKQIDLNILVISRILKSKSGRTFGKTVLISKYDVLIESKKFIAELKKKYTEDYQ